MKRALIVVTFLFIGVILFYLSHATAQRRLPQTREDFDIRAGLQRTLNGPEDAPQQLQARRAEPFRLQREQPGLQWKWSELTGAPSRLWSLTEMLSAPSKDDAETIARRFLKNNGDLLRLTAAEVDALKTARRYQDAHNGLTHVTLQQQLNGIEVFQGDYALHIDRDGQLLAASGELLPELASIVNATQPKLSAAAALRLAARDVEAELSGELRLSALPGGAEQRQKFDRAAGFEREVDARLVYFPLSARQARLAWELILWMSETPDVYLLVLDAEDGTVLFRHNLTCYDENPLRPHGLAYTKDSPRPDVPHVNLNPPHVDREDLPFRATPFNGAEIFPVNDPHYDWWAGRPANNLISNNTSTYIDRDTRPNAPDEPRLTVPDGNFSFPVDFTLQPTTPDYQRAAQVNLFYWINRYHDILYSLGFTEAAGNFQTNNFGRGGNGNDAILGEAQDGSGTNNANFATPPDGGPGRVQMYLWTRTTPMVDGDFDQGVIIHELTHGLTNRLVFNATGLTGIQSRGMGEGWSDWFGLALLRAENDDLSGMYAVGQYVFNNYAVGIRRFPYSTRTEVFPLTYKDVALSTQVHRIGEIWCNTLWEMRSLLIQRYGFQAGQRQALQLVVDGLKLTPRAPSFVDARNAILLADRTNNRGANQCLLWQAFAKRGLGFAAETTDANDGAPIEALESAPFCSTLGVLRLDKSDYLAGEFVNISLGDRNATGTLTVRVTSTVTGDGETIMLTPESGVPGSYQARIRLVAGRAVPNDGLLQGSVEAGDQIAVTYNDANNGGSGASVVAARAVFTREKIVFNDTVEISNIGWVTTGAWVATNARAASPTRSWTDSPAGNYANSSNAALTSPLLDLTGLNNITLSFAQSYDTQEGLDICAVELSTDDGQSWRRAAAFSGAQVAFRHTQIRLRGADNQARVRIRFALITNASINADGWYLDDIRVIGRSVSPVIIPPDGAPQPVVASLTPAFGPPAGGTRVLISGANFTDSEDTVVTFDGVPATAINVISGAALYAVAPAHAAGAVTVRVSNRYGMAALSNAYFYYENGGSSDAPAVTNLYPDAGSTRGGTVVTLVGANFTPETTVTFGGQNARVTFINSTTLRVETPFAATNGKVDVAVRNGADITTLSGAFNYINPTPPQVALLAPSGGETVFVNSVFTIRWNSSDNRAVASHTLSLFRITALGTQFVSNLATNLPGEARNFNWIVPTSLTNGEYRLRIVAIDDEGAETEAFSSGNFAIGRRWEAATNLPQVLIRLAVTSDGQRLYAIGGRLGANAVRTVRQFDTAGATSWTDLAALPAPLDSADAVFLRGRIYVSGGLESTTLINKQHFVYDIAANTWATSADLPAANYDYAAVADEARGVYYRIGGSSVTTGPSPVAAVRAYDPAANAWTDLPPMLNARTRHEAALIDGRLFVAGGSGATAPLASGEVYDFENRQWTPIASLSRPRAFATSFVGRTPAGDPLWILVGGQDPTNGASLGTEIYDVRRNRWFTPDSSFNLTPARSFLGGAVAGNFFYTVGGTPSMVERIRIDNITPTQTNQPPVLAVPPGPQVAVAGNELQFVVTANDLGSGNPIGITALGLPPGAHFNTMASTNTSARGLFRWTPAAIDAGKTFNVTFNASDGQLSDVKTVVIRVVNAAPLVAVNAADFRPEQLAADSIAALFGVNLAVRTETASEQPLPLELAGTKVTVNGVAAALFFVSPGQINFAIPAATEPGAATIVVSNPGGPAGLYSVGTIQIVPTAPAIFTSNGQGSGDANALATADGVRFQTPPFDVLVGGRPNILILFGTGLRRAPATNPNDDNGVAEAVNITIDGRPARVLFAGAQGGFNGLDQINVELPAALAGQGARRVELLMTVSGVTANRVTVPVK